MTHIFLTTISLLLLFLALSKAEDGPPTRPFRFPYLFPFSDHPVLPQGVSKNPQGQPNVPGQPNIPGQPGQQNLPQQADPFPGLKEEFYAHSCPKAEKIVADVLSHLVKTNPNAVANILRLQFHDCFVNGCDASVLLDFAPSGDKVEKSSMFNGLLLKGADMMDDIKTKLEEECPEVVSCADILAFASNAGMTMAGLPPRKPLGGRRDALISLATMAEADNLPLPDWTLDKMLELFNKKGFSLEEMVIMMGAHSVGISHCDAFMERVYNFKNTGKPDPTLTLEVVEELRKGCPNPGTPQYRNPPVNFDETPTVLDNLFYKNMVTRRKTLLITDSHLLEDPRTFPTVEKMAADASLFTKRFGEVMVKLSAVEVLTGNQGEVRKTCRSTN
ncbi:Peroxidase 36, partial [Mucuna pruriens]